MSGHRHQWYGGRTYAQHGDDLMALNVFKALGIERPSYLDVGAYHPFTISNTALLYERGCRGINVEPNEALFSAFLKERPDDINICCGVAPAAGSRTFYHVAGDPGRNTFDLAVALELGVVREVELPVLTLNQIVDTRAGGVWPDFLSIDIEGLDVAVLAATDFGPQPPKLIVAEALHGTADACADLRMVMRDKGFAPLCRAGSNIFFVRAQDLLDLR